MLHKEPRTPELKTLGLKFNELMAVRRKPIKTSPQLVVTIFTVTAKLLLQCNEDQ